MAAIIIIFNVKGKTTSVISNNIREPVRQKIMVVRIRYLILSTALMGNTLVSQKAFPSLVMAVAEIFPVTAGEIIIMLTIRSR